MLRATAARAQFARRAIHQATLPRRGAAFSLSMNRPRVAGSSPLFDTWAISRCYSVEVAMPDTLVRAIVNAHGYVGSPRRRREGSWARSGQAAKVVEA